ncbi:hypothetical protein COP2_031684 [Malus domestica]
MDEGDGFIGGGFNGRDLVEKEEGEELHRKEVEMAKKNDPLEWIRRKGRKRENYREWVPHVFFNKNIKIIYL